MRYLSASLTLTLALGSCAPATSMDMDVTPADARPRPDAIEPTFDVETRDAVEPMDTLSLAGCADWCTLRLTECGDPMPSAREQCAARCARASAPAVAAQCLRASSCIEIRAAFSRNAEVCGLEPVADSGVPVDTGVDARTDTGVDARTDTGVDAPSDAGVDARTG
jgi:hypothetical protein